MLIDNIRSERACPLSVPVRALFCVLTFCWLEVMHCSEIETFMLPHLLPRSAGLTIRFVLEVKFVCHLIKFTLIQFVLCGYILSDNTFTPYFMKEILARF